jgi:hypothetical protein
LEAHLKVVIPLVGGNLLRRLDGGYQQVKAKEWFNL